MIADDIDKVWKSINPHLVFSQAQNSATAMAVGAHVTTAKLVGEQDNERRKLKAAYDLMLEWCAAHRREMDDIVGEDHDHVAQPVYNPSIVALQQALQAIPLGYIAPVSRSWTIAAPMIWQAACHALVSIGRPAGSSPKSLAIRFTSALLKKAGFIVSADAIRKEIDKFSHRVSEAQGVTTPT
jgi:hypothetical protein